MNQPVPAPSVPLTSKQQDLVLQAEPMVKKMLRKLERMFPRASPEDMRQTVWLNVSEIASRKALSRDTFEADLPSSPASRGRRPAKAPTTSSSVSLALGK